MTSVLRQTKKTLTLDPASQIGFTVGLQAMCLVDPADLAACAANVPFWEVSASFAFERIFSPQNSLLWAVRVNTPLEPDTTANIFFDAPRYLTSLQSSPNSVTGNQISQWVIFRPTRVPSDLKLTPPDGGRLDLTLVVPGAPADRMEASANVTVAPASLTMTLSPNDASTTMEAVIKYTGPETTLKVLGPYDDGVTGSASKFVVDSPPKVSPLDANGTRTLVIIFVVPPNDFKGYYAAVNIAPDSAPNFVVKLQGSRNH